jgi:hypothetical protein
LIDLFSKNQAAFTRLQSDHDSKELPALLGIKRVTKPLRGLRPRLFDRALFIIGSPFLRAPLFPNAA